MMTLKEALNSGYKLADKTYSRGYVSRKVDQDSQPVMVAGGSRRGQLYVELPCWCSSRYYVRQYLTR